MTHACAAYIAPPSPHIHPTPTPHRPSSHLHTYLHMNYYFHNVGAAPASNTTGTQQDGMGSGVRGVGGAWPVLFLTWTQLINNSSSSLNYGCVGFKVQVESQPRGSWGLINRPVHTSRRLSRNTLESGGFHCVTAVSLWPHRVKADCDLWCHNAILAALWSQHHKAADDDVTRNVKQTTSCLWLRFLCFSGCFHWMLWSS